MHSLLQAVLRIPRWWMGRTGVQEARVGWLEGKDEGGGGGVQRGWLQGEGRGKAQKRLTRQERLTEKGIRRGLYSSYPCSFPPWKRRLGPICYFKSISDWFTDQSWADRIRARKTLAGLGCDPCTLTKPHGEHGCFLFPIRTVPHNQSSGQLQ